MNNTLQVQILLPAPAPKRSMQKQLDALYAELPQLQCRGLCQDSCGPIGVSEGEGACVERAGGRPLRFASRLRCTFLEPNSGRCEVYEVRPMICRLFGMVKGVMECPHGCVPERWLTRQEGYELMRRVHELTGLPAQPEPDETVPAWIAVQFKR